MKFKYMKVKLLDIIPQQQYLSVDKYRNIKKSVGNNVEYGDIYIIEYRDRIFSVDGHHRLFYLYEKGVEEVNVICELSDNNHLLYQVLADEALELGFKNISDLKNRLIDNYDDYEKKWIDKCQKILREEC